MAEELITCPVCGGSGVELQWTGENSISASTCKRCNGRGAVLVPKTNADWMRAMPENELVEFIGHNSLCDRVQGESGNWCNDHNCTDCLQEWLRQPAEPTESPDEDDRDSGLVEED